MNSSMTFTFSRMAGILTGLSLATPAIQAHADCKSLDGMYANESSKQGNTSHALTELAPAKEGSHLFLVERPAGGQGGFTSGGLRARPKVTPLAATVHLHYTGGRLMLTYMDAAGKKLAETAIANSPAAWKCAGNKLERTYQTMGGLGNEVRTRRTQEALFAEPNGDLHFTETTTILGVAGAKPSQSEVTFKRVAAAEPAKK